MDDSRRPRVCIIQRYLPPDPSGAGKQAITLARTLRNDGWEVFLVGDRPTNSTDTWPTPDIPVRWVEAPPDQPNRRAILAYWIRLLVTLYKCRDQFDIVHVHAVNFFHAFVIPAARLFRKPVLVRASLEGDMPDPSSSRSEWIHYQCLKFASTYVVLSRRLKNQYADSGIPEAKLTHIPNGVDTDRYFPLEPPQQKALRRELGLARDATILTYHGVFVARKSIHWALPLIEDFLLGTDVILLLIGSPGRDEDETQYYSRLKQRIERSRVKDSIVLTGFKSDVHRYLQASDLYFLSSTGEGLPNALLEAMAVGLIPIASRTSGAEEVIEHGESGFLFEPRNADQFTRCLEEAVGAVGEERGRKLGRSAVQRVQSTYSIQAVGEMYAQEYRRIASTA